MKTKLLILLLTVLLMFACSITPVVTDAQPTQPAYKSATFARPVATPWEVQGEGKKVMP